MSELYWWEHYEGWLTLDDLKHIFGVGQGTIQGMLRNHSIVRLEHNKYQPASILAHLDAELDQAKQAVANLHEKRMEVVTLTAERIAQEKQYRADLDAKYKR